MFDFPTQQFRTILNGVLVQDKDVIVEVKDDLTSVTNKKVTESEIADLLFANKLVKHTKSNTIVLAKDGQLFGEWNWTNLQS